MIDAAKLDELEAKAKAATPGEWKATCGYEVFSRKGFIPDDREVASCQMHRDVLFIAAANPETVLALITEIRTLRAALRPFAEPGAIVLEQVKDDYMEPLDLRIPAEYLRAAGRAMIVKPEVVSVRLVGKNEKL